jgi:hypothetical protein
MRARTLKPGFFKNENLCECTPLCRILFAGLWCLADRDGRLEDRPKRIKAEALPYDDIDVDALLDMLQSGGFIIRYSVDGLRCIQIVSFSKHQHLHRNEPQSMLPPMCREIPVQSQPSILTGNAPDNSSNAPDNSSNAPDNSSNAPPIICNLKSVICNLIKPPTPLEGESVRCEISQAPEKLESTVLPEWLDPSLWAAWRAHRAEIRARMTPRAERLCIEKLGKFKKQGFSPGMIINQSIENGWKGLFEPKTGAMQGESWLEQKVTEDEQQNTKH